MRLMGKVAVVTGAGQGIGRATALELAKAGAKVAVNDIILENIDKVVAEIKALGGDAIGVKADVSLEGEIKQAIDKVLSHWGRVDILANVAAIYPFVSILDMTSEQWNRVINVNLTGTFLCTKAVLPGMVTQKGGSIINVASVAGAVLGQMIGAPAQAHYAASKGGVLGFTRSAAIQLAQHGIRVNAIAPGGIDTEGGRVIGKQGGLSDEMMNEAMKAHAEKLVPLKRIGLPEDIARTVLFLASDDSSFITGQLLVVDGGITLQ